MAHVSNELVEWRRRACDGAGEVGEVAATCVTGQVTRHGHCKYTMNVLDTQRASTIVNGRVIN